MFSTVPPFEPCLIVDSISLILASGFLDFLVEVLRLDEESYLFSALRIGETGPSVAKIADQAVVRLFFSGDKPKVSTSEYTIKTLKTTQLDDLPHISLYV